MGNKGAMKCFQPEQRMPARGQNIRADQNAKADSGIAIDEKEQLPMPMPVPELEV